MSYLYILCTVLLTVYGQLVIKWQVIKAGAFPEDGLEKVWFLVHLLLNPWVISALLAALLASITWMAAMTKLQLSHAYPFMSLTFILVMLFCGLLFKEPITLLKIVGMVLVVLGLAIGSQG
jgi:multidrug transporter EmrE-like cation transporter